MRWNSYLHSQKNKCIAYRTNIAGKIPNEVGNLSNMVYYDVSNNYLSGELPDKIYYNGTI